MTATGPPTSIQQTVMTIGQLPNNTPTEDPPYPGIESPHWVSPARPLYGVQIINDYGEVVFEANQRDGLLIPAPGYGPTGATGPTRCGRTRRRNWASRCGRYRCHRLSG